MESLSAAIALLAGVVLGGIAVGWQLRRHHASQLEQIRFAERTLARAELATLEERALARERESEAARVALATSNALAERLRTELLAAREGLARIETELGKERQLAGEKLAFLETARTSLATQFQTLANEILEEKSRRFSAQHKSELDLLLQPLGEKLQSFEKKVQETYVTEAKERFSLAEEVRKLQAANLQISQDAVNLTRALKGEAKTRGNWGEVILERVLERAGLVRGREYEAQLTLEGELGKLRPDIVVRLPDDKHIVIDSKVSLVAYDRYYAADDDLQRESALREHVASLRGHIDALAKKNYQARGSLNTPDFVAMFVPIEPAFYLAAQRDDSLFLGAFEKKVVIVTPTTLLAMLSTVSTLWRRELQTQNALEIARRSGDLYDKFVGFVDALKEIGTKLTAAQDAYQLAFSRLAEGRGNLVRRVEQLKRLGARADKSLAPELLAGAGTTAADAGEAANEGMNDEEGPELFTPLAPAPASRAKPAANAPAMGEETDAPPPLDPGI